MTDYIRVSRLVAEVLSPMTYCDCNPVIPPPTETNRISAVLYAETTLTGRLTHVPALRVRMGVDRMPELVGKLTNTP